MITGLLFMFSLSVVFLVRLDDDLLLAHRLDVVGVVDGRGGLGLRRRPLGPKPLLPVVLAPRGQPLDAQLLHHLGPHEVDYDGVYVRLVEVSAMQISE